MVRVCLFYKKLPKYLVKWLYPFAINESFFCSTCLLTLSFVRVLDFSHSNACAVISHYYNLHFPNFSKDAGRIEWRQWPEETAAAHEVALWISGQRRERGSEYCPAFPARWGGRPQITALPHWGSQAGQAWTITLRSTGVGRQGPELSWQQFSPRKARRGAFSSWISSKLGWSLPWIPFPETPGKPLPWSRTATEGLHTQQGPVVRQLVCQAYHQAKRSSWRLCSS